MLITKRKSRGKFKNINDFLGIKKFKYGEVETENKVGIVTGLAWTEFGGEILKIETVHMPGKGKNANYWKTWRCNARVSQSSKIFC